MFEHYCVYNFSDFTTEFNSITINWGPTCMLGGVPLSPRHNYKRARPLCLKDTQKNCVDRQVLRWRAWQVADAITESIVKILGKTHG